MADAVLIPLYYMAPPGGYLSLPTLDNCPAIVFVIVLLIAIGGGACWAANSATLEQQEERLEREETRRQFKSLAKLQVNDQLAQLGHFAVDEKDCQSLVEDQGVLKDGEKARFLVNLLNL